jgi:hypothetical protein
MTVRRKERGGTAAALASANETPLQRELYVEYDTGRMKVGDGVTAYNSLSYIAGSVVVNWRGEWTTATAYVLGDGVSHGGSSYVCSIAHTSGTFATDLAALKWQMLAEKGDPGSGGNYETSSNLGTSAAIAAHFATSDLPSIHGHQCNDLGQSADVSIECKIRPRRRQVR